MNCCDEMKKFILEGNAIFLDDRVRIHGKPVFASDGDGHCDDETDLYTITYCPFCGKLITQKPSQTEAYQVK